MLKIDSLSASYGQKPILKGISLTVSPGEIVAVIGPNGAGKTTLIRSVSGILPIDTGQVLVKGRDVINLPAGQRARLLSVVPQARQMGGAYSVEQTVMMGRTAYMGWLGRESAADRSAVAFALKQTRLEGFEQRLIAELSGGEQQRVLLARALAQDAPVLLLDEPTNHLDLQHQAGLLNMVREQTREKGLAVLMAIHDLNQVSFFADKVALLVDGALKHFGTSQDVLRADYLSEAYQAHIEVVAHPESGAPLIFVAA